MYKEVKLEKIGVLPRFFLLRAEQLTTQIRTVAPNSSSKLSEKVEANTRDETEADTTTKPRPTRGQHDDETEGDKY